jgi:pectin methylesterase-like acyl-CoA thioesterase
MGPPVKGGKMTYRNAVLVACLTVVLCGLSQVAAGATLCVTKNPSPGCPYASINAAVAAASAGDVVEVSQGTYKEDIVVGKAISLVGANRNNTIIDATGLKNGIYVDGMDNAGLIGVSVSGFKVQNANFEGILVTNASGVTISDNYVLKNNINLDINSFECTDIPPLRRMRGSTAAREFISAALTIRSSRITWLRIIPVGFC